MLKKIILFILLSVLALSVAVSQIVLTQLIPMISGVTTMEKGTEVKKAKKNAFDDIPSNEILTGPKAENGKDTGKSSDTTNTLSAQIIVEPKNVRCKVSKELYGTNLEDLNHEIYGGLYAQMIFGESFEEGPDMDLPEDWLWSGFVGPNWRGMKTFKDGVISMQGGRGFQMLWKKAQVKDGILECDVMQPVADPGRSANLIFRASYQGGDNPVVAMGNRYTLCMLMSKNKLELWKGKDYPFGSRVLETDAKLGLGAWHHVKIEFTGSEIKVYINGATQPQLVYTDSNPLGTGYVGLDSLESRSKFRHLKLIGEGKDFELPGDFTWQEKYGMVSQWWDPLIGANAKAFYSLDEENPYNTDRSQKIEFLSGKGRVGLINRGLKRWGLNIKKDYTYTGHLYLRGSYKGYITVALQDHNGKTTYASQSFKMIGNSWSKYAFDLKSTGSDTVARFALWLNEPGTLWVDQVVLIPDTRELFKGLPVRKDIVEEMQKQGAKIIRLGGDATNLPGWKWKSLVGDPDKRRQFNHPWYFFQTGGFAFDEFIQFSQAAGMEPIVEMNAGETPQDAADFVEYCNGPVSSQWGSLRAKNGHSKPYNLHYLKLGNGFAGIEETVTFAIAVHKIDPTIKIIGGALTHHVDYPFPNDQMKKLAKAFKNKVYAISVLPYNDNLGDASQWERLIMKIRQQLLAGDPDCQIKLYSQEVNGGLHNYQRALANVQYLNVTEQYSDFVRLMTYCDALAADKQQDNGWLQGMVYFNNQKAWLQPPAVGLEMASKSFQPLCVESKVEVPEITVDAYPSVKVQSPALSVSATRNKSGNKLTLKIVNSHSQPVLAHILLKDIKNIAPTAKVICLEGYDLKSENTAKNNSLISPKVKTLTHISTDFNYSFSPYSYTILEMTGIQ